MDTPKKVRIVGLGCEEGAKCQFCGKPATILVSYDDFNDGPACNDCVGAGRLGEWASIIRSVY